MGKFIEKGKKGNEREKRKKRIHHEKEGRAKRKKQSIINETQLQIINKEEIKEIYCAS